MFERRGTLKSKIGTKRRGRKEKKRRETQTAPFTEKNCSLQAKSNLIGYGGTGPREESRKLEQCAACRAANNTCAHREYAPRKLVLLINNRITPNRRCIDLNHRPLPSPPPVFTRRFHLDYLLKPSPPPSHIFLHSPFLHAPYNSSFNRYITLINSSYATPSPPRPLFRAVN